MGLAIFKYVLPAATSLAFAGPAGLAVKKYLHAEAYIYIFTLIFQMLHHLNECPGLSLIFGLLGDKLLEYYAAYAFILSMFISLVNLTNFTRTRRLTIFITAGTTFSVRIYQTTRGYGVYSPPLIVASLLLAYSWGRKMYETKKVYPEKQIWLRTVLPALLFGAFSLVLLLCVEDDLNYGYIHSLHHIGMAVAIYLCLQMTEDGERPSNDKFCNCGRWTMFACCCC